MARVAALRVVLFDYAAGGVVGVDHMPPARCHGECRVVTVDFLLEVVVVVLYYFPAGSGSRRYCQCGNAEDFDKSFVHLWIDKMFLLR